MSLFKISSYKFLTADYTYKFITNLIYNYNLRVLNAKTKVKPA